MTTIRTALTAVALTAALAACGESAEVGVEKAFRGYHTALLARDFRTACSYNSPEATAKLLSSLRLQSIDAATCEDAFTAIYAEGGAADAADGVGRSVQIQGITVNGDDASVSWAAQLDGEQRPATTTMHRTEGRWLLVAD
jgi:predicted phage gp36 major capsid-like protein